MHHSPHGESDGRGRVGDESGTGGGELVIANQYCPVDDFGKLAFAL
jgi:hypothetical protein